MSPHENGLVEGRYEAAYEGSGLENVGKYVLPSTFGLGYLLLFESELYGSISVSL